jgi:hypothetical protein
VKNNNKKYLKKVLTKPVYHVILNSRKRKTSKRKGKVNTMNENTITIRGKEYTNNDTIERLNEALEEIEKIDFMLKMVDTWTWRTRETDDNNRRNKVIITEWIKAKTN